MITHSIGVSTYNNDSDFTNLNNGSVDSGTINCTWTRWDPACVNGSILCECNARDHDLSLILMYVFSRMAGLLLGPAYALIAFPGFLKWPRRECILIFLVPLVYLILYRPPENKTVVYVLCISVPCILQGALFFYLSIMYLHTSNFVTKRFKSSTAVYEFDDFYFTDTDRCRSINLTALWLVGVVGFLHILFETVPDLDGHLKALTSLGKRQDKLFYPNALMFIPVVLVTHVAVTVVFAVEHFRKEVNPDIPPNLNKQIFVLHIITDVTWYSGAFVTLLDWWEQWYIFVFLTIVEPIVLYVMAIEFYGD